MGGGGADKLGGKLRRLEEKLPPSLDNPVNMNPSPYHNYLENYIIMFGGRGGGWGSAKSTTL